MDINKRLNTVLEKTGWTKYRLAKESGIHESTLTNIFYRGTVPTITTLETICATLNISLSDFFSENEKIEVDKETKEFLLEFKSLPKEKQEFIIKAIKYMK